MRRSVVAAVDPTRDHDSVLEFAVGQALRRDRRVHVIVVVHLGRPERGHLTEVKLVGSELVNVAQDALIRCERRIAEWTDDLVITTEVMHGRTVPSLAAAAGDAEMLVMGHHRMTHLHHPPTPSVTHAVAGHAACPVYAVPDGWHELRDHPEPVIAAVEDEETARAIAATGFAEARSAGSALRVVCAWCYPDLNTDEESVRHGTGAEVRETLRRHTADALSDLIAHYRDVPCRVDAVHGPAAYTLITASNHGRLLVLGRHRPAHGWGSHLGPVTRSVLGHAQCPVVLVDARPGSSYGVPVADAPQAHST